MHKLGSHLKDADGSRSLSMYLEHPSGSQPRAVARLHERYLVAGLNQLEGQAIATLAPTFAAPARNMGVELSDGYGDVTFTYPTVFVQTIATYR